MKHKVFFVLVLFVTLQLSAQNSSLASIESMSLNEKTWMSNYGFPLKSYDFSNQKVNELLNSGLDLRRKGKTMTTISYVALGLGAVLRFARGNGGRSTALISYGVMAGGLTINLVGNGKKRKAVGRIQNAAYLLDEK